jgi:segregation and condensation protein B
MKRLPQPSADRLPALIESILFVADEPVESSALSKALRRPRIEVDAALDSLASQYEGRGLRIQRSNGLVQMVSAPESGPYVERFLGEESKQRLSSAALESLAIIAYRQPVTRASIEQVRGVNSDGPIASLIARGLVDEVGRAPGPGRPALLGTTMRFLEHFGLKHPADLPPLAGALPPRDAANEKA